MKGKPKVQMNRRLDDLTEGIRKWLRKAKVHVDSAELQLSASENSFLLLSHCLF